MKNKTLKYSLLTCIFLFFAGTGVAWAETCEVRTSCDTLSGWTIDLLQVTPQSSVDCEKALGTGIEECYLWEYQVYIGDPEDLITNGLTQLLLTIPATCGGEEPLFAGASDPNIELIPVGVGDTTSGFGKDIKTIAVARFEPNSTSGYFSFYSPYSRMAEGTVAIAVKKGDGSCLIGVPSHSCYEEPEDILTLSSTEYISTYDDNTGIGQLFRIIRDADTKCIIDADECLDPPNCNDTRQLDDDPIGEVIKVYNNNKTTDGEWGGGTNQKCNEALIKSVGNDTWVWISGRRVWR